MSVDAIYSIMALVCFVSSVTVICSSEIITYDGKYGFAFVAAVCSALWMIAIPCIAVSLITYFITKKVKNAWWLKNV